jgi:hypothetical protein
MENKPTIYRIKPVVKNPELDKLDNDRRLRVEEAMGKKFKSEWEWNRYKIMTLPKKK